jgi:hypothetical protein
MTGGGSWALLGKTLAVDIWMWDARGAMALTGNNSNCAWVQGNCGKSSYS